MARRRRSASRRTSRSRRRRSSSFTLSGRFVREALALVLVLLAIVSVIALFAPNAGFIVEPWHDVLAYLLGWGIAFAGPLLAGFALMLWMKSMQSERWMAASGAALVALSLLGMFHLVAGGGRRLSRTKRAAGCWAMESAHCWLAPWERRVPGSCWPCCSWSACCSTST